MKRIVPTLAFLLLLPAAKAEEVRVQLFTAHPPASIEIRATQGLLRWKTCVSCEEVKGERLSIDSAPINKGSKSGTEARFLISGRYELRAEGAPSIYLQFPLEVRSSTGRLSIVAAMPLENYVQHVLMAESGDFKNEEARKAMAVAITTYAKRFHGQHGKEGFDFCGTTHCQVFSWREPNDQVRAAVAATAGGTLEYQGMPAATYYHQNCGGVTAAASEAWSQTAEAYLSVHADPYCTVNGGLKWETSLTRDQIDAALRASGITPPSNWQQIEIRTRTKSGRAEKVILAGQNTESFSLSASSLRFAVNRALGWNKLRSNLYEARNLGDRILFSGRGAGHGVGLCQSGAEEMARQGKNYQEILNFYFPGTELSETKASPSASESWQKRSDERFDLLSMRPDADSEIFLVAERILHESEEAIGWKLPFRPRLQTFATLDSYRDTTGQPGWVAASTRGHTIRLQPLTELRHRGILESTLRHELAHLLVESRAKVGTPLWFREGLVLCFAGNSDMESAVSPLSRNQIDVILSKGDSEENTRHAYQSAFNVVRVLIQQHSKREVLNWLKIGLPSYALLVGDGVSAQAPHQ